MTRIRDLTRTLANGFEQCDELAKPIATEMSHGSAIFPFERGLEAGEKLEAGRGDACEDHPAVARVARPGDEAAGLETVEKTGHIRVVGDHASRNLAAGQTGGLGAAENAQNIVLAGGEAMGLESEGETAQNGIRGPHEIDGGLGREGRERARLFDLGEDASRHAEMISVTTTIVKRTVVQPASVGLPAYLAAVAGDEEGAERRPPVSKVSSHEARGLLRASARGEGPPR